MGTKNSGPRAYVFASVMVNTTLKNRLRKQMRTFARSGRYCSFASFPFLKMLNSKNGTTGAAAKLKNEVTRLNAQA